MTKAEYLSQLEARIKAFPQEERDSAMRFYAEYFDDAGAENEQQVIEQLGPPERLAEQLMGAAKENPEPVAEKKRGPLFWVLALLASPFLLVLAATALCVVVTVAMVLFCVMLMLALVAVVPFIVSASMLLSGFVAMVVGLLVTFSNFPTMLWFTGLGLAVLSLGALIWKPGVIIMQHCLKAVFRLSGWLIMRFRRLRFKAKR